MKILIVGLNHKTAPVAVREKIAPNEEQLTQWLRELTELEGVEEGLVLSTCNRFEVWLVCSKGDHAQAVTIRLLAHKSQMATEVLEPHLYIHEGEAAVAHGYRVAASLDSLVVGEAQVLGQVKQAWQRATEVGSCGSVLGRYCHQVFRVAKKVRSDTGLAKNPVSIASVAVALARKIFGTLEGHVCLLIGAGEMCELAARHLAGQGVRILVANRTLERARELAARFDGAAFGLEDLGQRLAEADIILSSTGAMRPIVSADMVRAALRQRRYRSQFYIDIAVPRDLAPEIAQIDNAFLYDLDDLEKISRDNRQDRNQEIDAAEFIVQNGVAEFMSWMRSLEVVPTLVALRQSLEQIRDQEVEKALKGWTHLPREDRERVVNLARILVNRILHVPLTQLREQGTGEEGAFLVDAAKKLFRLGDEPQTEIQPMNQ
ncbi:MAG: glutamyl-tRNA reductase [Magnetococcales bacterium]|nr:glutamyl-tRNA reductase [Magnetococcales bacterium]MBF0150886.1 glutamyl-tRNA reductase [Magnetococcales bacterium]MBF0172685.1 glutamyl-tRNA reductase [Magnetococcales bacterium]MBF0348022.1 glutamyl-tRNA reductase [Magnetococcales bacterium]MBF0629397.1 glutamyl-tRNA reductase [Magnetococcales bacterium]